MMGLLMRHSNQKEDAPLVSVVMPIYNSERFVLQAVESIVCQTYQNIEVILIDDGSTDQSVQVVESYLKKLEANKKNRIKFIKNEKNIGLIKTLNYGFSLAKGMYIARMDSDDISFPARIEKQVNFLQENLNTGVLGTEKVMINVDGSPSWQYLPVPTSYCEILLNLLNRSCISHPTVMFRASILGRHFSTSEIYENQYKHAEDYALWLRLLTVGVRIENLSEPLLYQRRHSGSVTKVFSKQQQSSAILAMSKWLIANLGIESSNIASIFTHPSQIPLLKTKGELLELKASLSSYYKFANEKVGSSGPISFEYFWNVQWAWYFVFSILNGSLRSAYFCWKELKLDLALIKYGLEYLRRRI